MSWNFNCDDIIDEKLDILEEYQYVPEKNKECRKLIVALLENYSARWNDDPALEQLAMLNIYRNRYRFLDMDRRAIGMAIDRFCTRT